jgi:hypothetical protein
MKIKSSFVAVLLMGGVLVAPTAQAVDYEWPKVESFTVSPIDIDLSQSNPILTFTLVVSHNIGISSTFTSVNLANADNNVNLSTRLNRVDSPIDFNLKQVTFKGTLVLPNSTPAGLYTFTADPVNAFSTMGAGSTPNTGTVLPKKFNDLVDGETSIIVRINGDLNFNYQTFVGPSYSSQNSVFDGKPRALFTDVPIWKVGETYKVSDYFEMRTPLATLQISTSSPSVCTSDGKIMKFIDTGVCSFTVFTPKTKNYQYKSLELSQTISAARPKQIIGVTNIADQTVASYPKIIVVTPAYTTTGDLVVPNSTTPGICTATGGGVNLIASGTCTLTYQASATATQLASDSYTQSFKVKKDGEVLVEPTPTATPTPVATPAPTPTPKPVVKKTITCTKGTKSVKRTGVSPKCPKGYKLKR